MLTPTQKKAAQSIVNIFETSAVLGDYGKVAVIPGDAGHLSFGRSQASLAAGSLFALLAPYCANAGARFGARLQPWLPRIDARDVALDGEIKLHNLLRACADDPVMRDTQDQFFDDGYWRPTVRAAADLGVVSALGVAVIYDSLVQGSWAKLRELTKQHAGTLAALGERAWITAYVATRRQWLADSSSEVLRSSVYRMDAFARLIAQGRWGLDLPLVVRGEEISLASLSATPPGCYDGPQPCTRSIGLQSPLPRGLDVRLLQLGLSDRDADICADGVFGPHSAACVKQYQAASGLAPTGVADPALIAQLLG